MPYGIGYGLRQSLPIVFGYAPVAITFGFLASQYGISFWQAGLMSFLVFAGASQFIAIEMLHQGSTVWMIGLTTLIVNFRLVLMSVAMLPHFPSGSRRWAAILTHGITDETFVLNSSLLTTVPTEEQRRRVMLGVNLGAFCSWVVFSLLGGVIGERVMLDFAGFDFALLALFIVLTAGTLTKENYQVYILAAVLAVVFKLSIPGKFYLILSVVLAAGLGAFYRQKKKQKLLSSKSC